MRLENILSKGKKILRNLVGSVIVGAGILSLGGVRNSEASIVQDYTQTAEEPIITMLDYRVGLTALADTGTNSLALAQSFIALDNFIIDGSLKLARISENEHNMYLKIWPDNNGIPDIENELGTTANELTPRGDTLTDYYLREFGFTAIQITPGERYWIGLYNPDLNWHGFGVIFSWEYGYMDLYPDGFYGLKNGVWDLYDSESRDLGFSVTFSNIPEPNYLTFLGVGLLSLALTKKLKK